MSEPVEPKKEGIERFVDGAYKLVYFTDKSTAVIADRVNLGITVCKGTFDMCIKAQRALTYGDRLIYNKNDDDTTKILAGLPD